MTGHESGRGFEEASATELETTYNAFVPWVERNGDFELDKSAVVKGEQNGTPIIIWGPPMIAYTIRGDILRQLVPRAADALEVGESITIDYCQPYFDHRNTGPHEYIGALCRFAITKSEQSLLKTCDLYIHPHDSEDDLADVWSSGRDETPKVVAQKPIEYDAFRENMARLYTENIFELDKITSAECEALQEIAAKLDEIKTLQESSV